MSACVRLCVRTKICFLACMSLLRNIDFSGRDPFRLQADYNYSHMRKSIPRSQFKIRMRKTIFTRSLKRCLFSHADLLRSHMRKCLQCFFLSPSLSPTNCPRSFIPSPIQHIIFSSSPPPNTHSLPDPVTTGGSRRSCRRLTDPGVGGLRRGGSGAQRWLPWVRVGFGWEA